MYPTVCVSPVDGYCRRAFLTFEAPKFAVTARKEVGGAEGYSNRSMKWSHFSCHMCTDEWGNDSRCGCISQFCH